MGDERVDVKRRRFITTVTSSVGLVGVGAATVPFIASMMPSARARAAGAPVEVDISRLQPGQMLTVEWRGKPVWIIDRTEEMLQSLVTVRDELADPDSTVEQQPTYAANEYRSIRPEILVVVGICTHLGCAPTRKFEPGTEEGMNPGWLGGFFCPCHGSKFDLAGRVYSGVPAPTNLVVPPYTFLSDDRILVGEDHEEGEAA